MGVIVDLSYLVSSTHSTRQRESIINHNHNVSLRHLVASSIATEGAAVVQVRVDTRIKLVGNVRVVRTSSLLGGAAARGGVAASRGSTNTTTEILVTGAVVEVRVNAGINLVGEVRAVRASVGGVGVGVVSTARGQAAGGTILASVAVDARVSLVGEVGIVRTSGGCAGVTTGFRAIGSSASSTGRKTGASGGVAGASCRVCSAMVYSR